MQAPSSRVPAAKARDATRTPSSEAWTGPSSIVTFVRCLRLLGLDLLEDWPEITEDTFAIASTKQNLQTRTKCVEWSLYRLFELWSPSETRDKLRPFFPPLTPLQSLNLRAALYRALTELKKNGVLGKEVVLRKTMLDECKGEKFEEVISAFAMTVLRRVARAQKDERLELALSDHLSGQQQAQLLPLVIALRSSLQQQLSQHRKIQEQAAVYAGLLAQHQASIQNRRALLSGLPVPEDRLKAIGSEDVVESWVGDDRWAEILVSGPTRSEDRFLTAPFEEGWEAVLDGKTVNQDRRPDLLEDLNARIAKQETRLRKWKTFAASLQNRQARTSKAPRVSTSSEEYSSALPQFDRHQSLQLCEPSIRARPEGQPVPMSPSHETLLAAMEAELVSLDRRNFAQPLTLRGQQGNEHRTLMEHEGRGKEQRPEDLHKLPRRAFKTSPIQRTFVPPSFGSEESSAPEKDPYPGKSSSHGEPTSIMNPEAEREPPGFSASMNPMTSESSWQKLEDVQSHEAYLPAHSAAHPTTIGRELSSVPGIIAAEALPSQKAQNKYGTLPSSSGLLATPATTLSAAAHDSREEKGKAKVFAPESRGIRAEQELKSIGIEQPSTRTMAPTPTLLERTRQSMSLLPNSAARAGRRSLEKRASSKQTQLFQAYPVNQFETPRKVRTSGASPRETNAPLSGSSTPRDELFSDAAAYDSVFKSRPRVALSPALSPDKSGFGQDSMLEDDLAYLTLGDV